jgi:hypothetical protein
MSIRGVVPSSSIFTHELDEAPITFIFHPDGKKRPSRASGSSVSPGFRPSSIRRAQAITGPPGRARGLRTKEKRARNGEETSRALCGPDLSAREGGRRPHRIVFRASSSSPRIVFRAL